MYFSHVKMVLIKLQSDKKRFVKQQPVYYKGGSIYQPINSHQVYLKRNQNQNKIPQSEGGFLNLASIIDAGKSIVNIVKDNKDLISSGISAVKSISDTTGAIADTVKKSKELEELKMIQKKNKESKTKKKEIQLTEVQLESLQKLGQPKASDHRSLQSEAKSGQGIVKF